MRQFLSEAFAPTFAGQFLLRLEAPHDFGKGPLKKGGGGMLAWFVSGLLPLKTHGESGQTKSRMTVLVRPDWLEVPPSVIVPEQFIRRDSNWHTYEDGRLCYVLEEEWRDRLGRILTQNSEDICFLMDYAATWLLSASDSLITRHLLGARHGIEKWPDDWQAYAHGEDGVKEYRREKGAP